VIELVLTCFVGSLAAGFVVTAWVWRSLWPSRLVLARREA
jgi:hypothetical protein